MAMIELRKEVETAALAELNRANAKFPLFASTHEGYAVTLEEVEEAQEAMDNVKSSWAYYGTGYGAGKLLLSWKRKQAQRRFTTRLLMPLVKWYKWRPCY